MEKKLMLLVLLAIVFYPSFAHAEDKAPAAVAAEANAASEEALDAAADEADDLALEDEDLIADEDLALDEDAEDELAAGEKL